MKVIKKILYVIVALVTILCAGVLLCAFNPSLTKTLAAKLSESGTVQEGGAEAGEADGAGVNISAQILEIGGEGDADGYILPSQSEVTSPEAVQGRSGYEPVRESGEEIADEDAEALQEALQTGDTGDGLDFDADFYPYYYMLDGEQQALYRQIYANALKLTESFAPVVNLDVNRVTDAFEAVYNDHPELFWLETGYSCKYLRNGTCVELTLQYHPVADNLEEAQKAFSDAAQLILDGAQGLATDGEKEKAVHDALVQGAEYDESASMSQSAYSALVGGRSVCAGYARAFQYLMMELGVPCYYCTGYSGENHAWDIIRLDGGYYNVDVTWDDTDPSTYDYYNKTDAEYAGTHMRKGLSVNLPACNGTGSGMTRTDGTGSSGTGTAGTDSGEADSSGMLSELSVEDLVNEDPTEPLTWEEEDVGGADETTDQETLSALEKAGLTQEEVMDDLTEYYADCLAQMTAVGTGQQQFVNVIPQALWQTVERAYSSGEYQTGYVNEGLKKLGMQNFAIQIQAQRLNGGYYRLYHNISTW